MKIHKGKKESRKATKLIALNTLFVIFGLTSAFTGTYAWFVANQTSQVTAGAFSVVGPPEINFDIYYLHNFEDAESATQDGNLNSITGQFSGYETEYNDAFFTQITFGLDGHASNLEGDPTNITQLWPAHRLTFAIVLTSGTFSSFSINRWGEDQGSPAKEDPCLVEADSCVRLSWAINIFGAAYQVGGESDSALTAIQDGFADYKALAKSDKFDFDQEHSAELDGDNESDEKITVIDGMEESSGKWSIIYFTIEFSNDEETFYSQSDESPYYYVQDDDGNSNCYEGLRLTKLEFGIQ